MIRKKGICGVIIMLSAFTLTNIKAMEVVSCGGFDSVPYKPLEFVGNVVSLIKIVVPIILIVMGLIDFTKAVVTSEDKIRSEKGKLFIKRIINAIMVYFVIAIVQFIFSLLGTGDSVMTCASCMLGNDCSKENVNINGSTNTGSSSKGKDVKATKILIVQGETAEVVKGSSLKLGVIVQPNNTTNTKVTYKSSKTDIATVNSSGKVTAKKIGTATITVTSKSNSKAKDSIKIKVVKKKSSNNSNNNNDKNSSSTNNNSSDISGFIYYNQADYGNTPFCGGGKTVHSSGCGAASFAMVASNLVDSSYNPSVVAKWLCSNGHGGGALSDSWFTNKKLLDKFGLQSTKLFGDIGTNNISDAKKKITKELKKGKMIILYIPGHYVALAPGKNNNVIFLNPGYRAQNGTYTIDKIYDITKNYRDRCSNSNNCGWHGAYSFYKK